MDIQKKVADLVCQSLEEYRLEKLTKDQCHCLSNVTIGKRFSVGVTQYQDDENIVVVTVADRMNGKSLLSKPMDIRNTDIINIPRADQWRG